jgi:hypothetical protein
MQRARSTMMRHPALLAALMFCALLARALVPVGYMPAASGGIMTLVLCPGATLARPPAMNMSGMHHGEPDRPVKAEQPCAFSAMAGPLLAPMGAALLVAALAFAFLIALLPVALVLPASPARLRPPLRAPPVPA